MAETPDLQTTGTLSRCGPVVLQCSLLSFPSGQISSGDANAARYVSPPQSSPHNCIDVAKLSTGILNFSSFVHVYSRRNMCPMPNIRAAVIDLQYILLLGMQDSLFVYTGLYPACLRKLAYVAARLSRVAVVGTIRNPPVGLEQHQCWRTERCASSLEESGLRRNLRLGPSTGSRHG